MSAWSKDLTNAPKNKQILFRYLEEECPMVVYWEEDDEWKGWLFADDIVSSILDSVEEKLLPNMKWALIPE